MSLDPSQVGYETEPFFFEYDWKTVALYALGVGATRDELDYLYEARGPRVLPSFAVVPAYPALVPLVERARADMNLVVHGSQSITLHKPLPPAGRLRTIAKLEGIYDLKRLSQVVFSTRTDQDGELLCETEWTLIVRDTGGFGGPRPPKVEVPKLPSEGTPSFERTQLTSPEQALLYRLSGDLNPLHADPEFARAVGFAEGPILHGLCTFGYVTRAVIQGACGGNPDRLRSLGVQFKKPVWPGESLRTVGYEVEPGTFALAAYANDRPEAVVGSAWARIGPA
ncbi:MAG TPA: MaoC/PaaZ C-terminal domain-containing protein [Polyangiaceae bacterium]|nr:MaoC/PaaZ C-terminal domain-containing protein [Polyangiaceae bacterium]